MRSQFQCEDCKTILPVWQIELSYLCINVIAYEDYTATHYIGTGAGTYKRPVRGIVRCAGQCRGATCSYCQKKFGECECVSCLEVWDDPRPGRYEIACMFHRESGQSYGVGDSKFAVQLKIMDFDELPDMRYFSKAHIVHGDSYVNVHRLIDP